MYMLRVQGTHPIECHVLAVEILDGYLIAFW